METVTSWGKGRTDSTKRTSRLLGLGHALVVVSLLAAFISLRAAHARQIEVTRDAFFVYSASDGPAFDLARALNDQAGIAIYDLADAATRDRLQSARVEWRGTEPGLVLPSDKGWVVVQDEPVIHRVLAPLRGAPTENLLGAFAALAAAAVWLLGGVWRSSLAYLGTFWPVLGIGALGVAMPFCQGCALADNRLTPFATTLGLLGFVAVLIALRLRKQAPRTTLEMLAAMALVAGLAQAVLIWLQPKFCVPCLLGGAAWVGVFCFGSHSVSRTRVRAIFLGRPATLVLAVLALGLAIRHGHAALTTLAPGEERPFATIIGKPLGRYFVPERTFTKGLYVIGSPGCGACDLARERLREYKVTYTALSFCTLFKGEQCIDPDFQEVSPLFVFCDSNGVVVFAEAGWNEERYSQARFIERLKRWTSETP